MGNVDYDVVILGGGAAGFTAAIYCQRYGLKSVVISKEFGGATSLAGEIENYPGFVGTGADLMEKFMAQAEKFGAEKKQTAVKKVSKEGNIFTTETDDGNFTSYAVIAGLGSKHRTLGIPGEHEYLGRGVSICATCDGNFFRNKTVAVIGGNDSAAKAVMYLSEICKKVYVSYRKEPMRCEPIYLKRMEKPNVEFIYNSVPTEIVAENNKVKALKLKAFGEKPIAKELVEVDGVFIEIGYDPITEPFASLGLELEHNAIKVNKDNRTNVKGFYAAGDGTNAPFKQTVVAAAGGAVAAKSCYDDISSLRE
jgi:thioredoxin reductase (NADPH)